MPELGKEYLESLRVIKNELSNTEVALQRLETLREAIELEMEALKSSDYKKPSKALQEETAAACSGAVKAFLQRSFAVAATKTGGDITPFMVEHLNEMVRQKVTPDISIKGLLGRSGKAEVKLERACRNALGRPKDWFDIVQKARDAGGFGKSDSVSVRMYTWVRIFNAGTGITDVFEEAVMEAGGKQPGERETNIAKSRLKKNTSLYTRTMSLRYQFLSQTAPYWYFLEHGNKEFKRTNLKGTVSFGTSPYPVYGAPGAITAAEERSEKYINQKLLELANEFEPVFEEGYQERLSFIKEIDRLISTLKSVDVFKLEELIEKQVKKYHKTWSMEELNNIAYDRIINTVISGIQNKEFRIQDPSLPGSGRMRLLSISKKIGLYNIRLAETLLKELGVY